MRKLIKKEDYRNQKEKYMAEINAKLVTFGETLHESKTRKELRKENWPELQINAAERKHQTAVAKLQKLKQSDDRRQYVGEAKIRS